MKKIIKSLCLILIASLTAVTLFGCDEPEEDNKLRIILRTAGFGDSWIYELERIFEESHPDVDVEITSLYEANTLIKNHLESKKNNDDLYISIGNDWKSYAAQGYFAELDEYLLNAFFLNLSICSFDIELVSTPANSDNVSLKF